jgi:hypothetical protein
MRAAKAPNGGTGANRWMSHACVKGCDEPCVHGHRSARILQWTLVAILLQIPKPLDPSRLEVVMSRGAYGIATSDERQRRGAELSSISDAHLLKLSRIVQTEVRAQSRARDGPESGPRLAQETRIVCGAGRGRNQRIRVARFDGVLSRADWRWSPCFTRQRADLFPSSARAHIAGGGDLGRR